MSGKSGHVETGGCLCGHIKFEYDAPYQAFMVCHCTDCQRATGTPLAPIIMVAKDSFRLLTGELKGWKNPLNVTRFFCPHCGSPYLSGVDRIPDVWFIKTGALDNQPTEAPSLRCWNNSTPGWFHMEDAEVMIGENPDM